jgi:hypothetical protein
MGTTASAAEVVAPVILAAAAAAVAPEGLLRVPEAVAERQQRAARPAPARAGEGMLRDREVREPAVMVG